MGIFHLALVVAVLFVNPVRGEQQDDNGDLTGRDPYCLQLGRTLFSLTRKVLDVDIYPELPSSFYKFFLRNQLMNDVTPFERAACLIQGATRLLNEPTIPVYPVYQRYVPVLTFVESVGVDKLDRYFRMAFHIAKTVRGLGFGSSDPTKILPVLADNATVLAALQGIEDKFGNDTILELMRPFQKLMGPDAGEPLDEERIRQLTPEVLTKVLTEATSYNEFLELSGLTHKDATAFNVITLYAFFAYPHFDAAEKLGPLLIQFIEILHQLGVLDVFNKLPN